MDTADNLQLLSSPFLPVFDEFIDSIETHCFIASPYITFAPVRRLVEAIEKRHNAVTVTLLTDLSLSSLVQGSTDINALLFLCNNLPNLQICYLSALHAKVYIADTRLAIIGSANFTTGGATKNFEYGVRISNPLLVQQVTEDMNAYANLGNSVLCDNLRVLKEHVDGLREAVREEKFSISRKMREATEEIERQAQDDLLRIQVEGRTIHAIFVETILFLLREHPLTTHEIEEGVRAFHPDLCDEAEERVIDGKRFGKLWKHQVRNAQVALRRKNIGLFDK